MAFAEKAGFDPSLFTWAFGEYGDLVLTDHLSPTATEAGFEYYSSEPDKYVDINFLYDGQLLASGRAEYIRVEVDNNWDITAIGKGRAYWIMVILIYDEIMAISGGTGVLDFVLDSFYTTNDAGICYDR